mgnify:CR=1 FL=1
MSAVWKQKTRRVSARVRHFKSTSRRKLSRRIGWSRSSQSGGVFLQPSSRTGRSGIMAQIQAQFVLIVPWDPIICAPSFRSIFGKQVWGEGEEPPSSFGAGNDGVPPVLQRPIICAPSHRLILGKQVYGVEEMVISLSPVELQSWEWRQKLKRANSISSSHNVCPSLGQHWRNMFGGR